MRWDEGRPGWCEDPDLFCHEAVCRQSFRSRSFGLDAPSLLPSGAPLSSTTRVQAEVQHASADSILITSRFGVVTGPDDFLRSLIGDQDVTSQAIGLILHVLVEAAVPGMVEGLCGGMREKGM